MLILVQYTCILKVVMKYAWNILFYICYRVYYIFKDFTNFSIIYKQNLINGLLWFKIFTKIVIVPN